MDNKKINENEFIRNFSSNFEIILKTWSSFRLALDSYPECLNQYIEIEDTESEIIKKELEIIVVIGQLTNDIYTILV